MMTYFKKDKLFEAIKNLSNDDKVKLHNYFNGYIVNSKVWSMEQLDEYFEGCTPHDIVDCITTAGGNFNIDDPYFYEDEYYGLVSIQGDNLYKQEPFTDEYDYIAQLDDHETTETGIQSIDEILKIPNIDESELRNDFNRIIEKALARKLKELYKLQGGNTKHLILDDFNEDVLEAIMKLSETVTNDFFENW